MGANRDSRDDQAAERHSERSGAVSADATGRAERGQGAGAARPQSVASGGAGEPGRGGEAAALVSNQVCDTLPKKRRDLRFRRRHEAQQRAYRDFAEHVSELRELGDDAAADTARLPRVFWCGHKLKDTVDVVEVRRSVETGAAHYGRVQRCGSVWRCPVCSSAIRHVRSLDVQTAVERWQGQGRGLYLVTVTLRHHQGDDLAQLLDLLSSSWRGVVTGKAWRMTRDRFGLVGYVRSLEITYGKSGWHPHFHFLYFADAPASETAAAELEQVVLRRWIDQVQKRGGKLPNGHGCDARAVDEHGRVAAQYVAKVAGESNIAFEVARADMKESDEGAIVTPFEMLDFEGARYAALWRCYCDATKGKRSVFFSRGLRALVGLGAEQTDDEIVAEMESRGELVAAVDGAVYESMVSDAHEKLGAVLGYVERGDVEGAAAVCGCVVVERELVDSLTGETLVVPVIRPPI